MEASSAPIYALRVAALTAARNLDGPGVLRLESHEAIDAGAAETDNACTATEYVAEPRGRGTSNRVIDRNISAAQGAEISARRNFLRAA